MTASRMLVNNTPKDLGLKTSPIKLEPDDMALYW